MRSVLIVEGGIHRPFGEALTRDLGVGRCGATERFPDGELQVHVADVTGKDAFIVQPLCAPIGEALLELVLLADACRRSGARSVSAAIPYLGYARQERRSREGQPLGAEVVCRMLSAARLDRALVVDVHAPAVEGFFNCPVDNLSAMPLLAGTLASTLPEDAVVVSPDVGATKLARRVADHLKLPTALVHKRRLSGSEVVAEEVVGDVRGRRPIIVDDMISTGGTIAAATRAVLSAGALPEVAVMATHGLFVGAAPERLRALPIARLLVSDSIPASVTGLPVETVSIVPMLANAIRRITHDRPLGDLLAPP